MHGRYIIAACQSVHISPNAAAASVATVTAHAWRLKRVVKPARSSNDAKPKVESNWLSVLLGSNVNMLSAQLRLTEDWQIRRALRQGVTYHSRSFVLNQRLNRRGQVRFAFIASKKVGNAVVRNRAVRLLREAVRLRLGQFPGSGDFVFVARKGIDQLKMQLVRQELDTVLNKMKQATPPTHHAR